MMQEYAKNVIKRAVEIRIDREGITEDEAVSIYSKLTTKEKSDIVKEVKAKKEQKKAAK